MDNLKVVTNDNYKQKVLQRMILVCWIILLICFVIKLFGGNFFAFVGESKIVEYIAYHLWAFIPIQFIFYALQSFLYFGIIFKCRRIKLSLLLTMICFSAKLCCILTGINIVFGFIVEFICLIIIPIIINPREWYMPVILNILILIYQTISTFTKNIGLIDFPYDNVVGYVFMIDYYIMLGLTLLYYKKGDFKMTLGFWFLSKDKAQLEAYKQIVTKKYEKKIAKIDAKIEKAK